VEEKTRFNESGLDSLTASAEAIPTGLRGNGPMRYLLPSHLRRDLERGRANLFGTHAHPDGREAIGCIRVCQEIGRVTAARSRMLEI
jgi:hypothetical protein